MFNRLLLIMILVFVSCSGTTRAANSAPASDVTLTIESGHAGSIRCVRFSPGGETLATAGNDSTVILWSYPGCRCRRLLTLNRHPVDSLAFSSDGKMLAAVDIEDNVYVWDAKTGDVKHIFGYPHKPFNHDEATPSPDRIAFTPAATNLIVGGSDGMIHVWNIGTEKEYELGDTSDGIARKLSLTADGRYLLVAYFSWGSLQSSPGSNKFNHQAIKIFDLVRRTSKSLLSNASEDPLIDVAASPKSALFAINQPCSIINAPTGKTLFKISNRVNGFFGNSPDEAFSVGFSPDGNRLAVGGWHTAWIWNLENYTLSQTLSTVSIVPITREKQFGERVQSLRFSPGGNALVGVVDANSLWLWSFKGSKQPLALGTRTSFITYDFSIDGMTLATGGDDNFVKIWSTIDGAVKTAGGRTDWVANAMISPDRHFLALGTGSDAQVPVENGAVRVWDLQQGRLVKNFLNLQGEARVLEFSPSGDILTAACESSSPYMTSIISWRLQDFTEINRFSIPEASVKKLVFAPDGSSIVVTGLGFAKFSDLRSKTQRDIYPRDVKSQTKLTLFSPTYSPDGNSIAFTDGWSVWQYNVADIKCHEIVAPQKSDISSIQFGPHGLNLVVAYGNGQIDIRDLQAGKTWRIDSLPPNAIHSVEFSHNGEMLAIADNAGSIYLANLKTKKIRQVCRGQSDNFRGMFAFSLQDKELACLSNFVRAGDRLRIWKISTCERIANPTTDVLKGLPPYCGYEPLLVGPTVRLTSPLTNMELAALVTIPGPSSDTNSQNGGWMVQTPAGLFDVGDISELNGVHWTVKDDPLDLLSPEMFMKHYYEPRLLPRLLAGNILNPQAQADAGQKPLSALNRAQPLVRIVSAKAGGTDKDGYPTVSVTVQVDTVKRTLGNGKTYISGAKDIRLFRDKQVVGAYPETKDGGELTSVSDDSTLTAEQQADGTVTYTRIFDGIELPRNSSAKEVRFTAYAFNVDDVKSKNSEPFPVPLQPAAVSKLGTAYVVSIGMGTYENDAWNLPYAAPDADRLNAAVCKSLGPDGRQFDHVARVTLTGAAATKEHVKDLLMILAGQGDKLSAAERDAVDPKHELAKVHPDDFLFLSFCTHGLTDDAGTYYLLPADTGKEEGLVQSHELKKHCITDGDLSYWLRDVDAGRMAMVVDACHAGAVAGLDFKPGPMGSRGMGQLAYDKGMRLLASTQASSVALEVGGDIKSGLLTYALVEDGIKGNPATLGAWLQGAVEDVPLLYAKLPKKVEGVVSLGGATVIDAKTMGTEPPSLQTPQLFDFISRLPESKDIQLSSIAANLYSLRSVK